MALCLKWLVRPAVSRALSTSSGRTAYGWNPSTNPIPANATWVNQQTAVWPEGCHESFEEWLASTGQDLDSIESSFNRDGFVVLRLASPPALTAGRVETPRDAKKSDEETRGSGESVSANVAAARRERKASRPFVTWGTAGKASDFTAGEASRAATVVLRFRDPEAAARAAAALERAWPGKNNAPPREAAREIDAETLETPSRRRATAAAGFGYSLASWLGKRARPDGRVHQPPRKRYAADGPADPGFVS